MKHPPPWKTVPIQGCHKSWLPLITAINFTSYGSCYNFSCCNTVRRRMMLDYHYYLILHCIKGNKTGCWLYSTSAFFLPLLSSYFLIFFPSCPSHFSIFNFYLWISCNAIYGNCHHVSLMDLSDKRYAQSNASLIGQIKQIKYGIIIRSWFANFFLIVWKKGLASYHFFMWL